MLGKLFLWVTVKGRVTKCSFKILKCKYILSSAKIVVTMLKIPFNEYRLSTTEVR